MRSALEEPGWFRWSLLVVAVAFIGVMAGLPLLIVFVEAFKAGAAVFLGTFSHIYNWEAIKLSLLVTAAVVPLNLVFGLAAAWTLAKFTFRGSEFLLSLVNMPFTISPVVVGLLYVLYLGSHSPLGSWLDSYDIQIIYAFPGLVLVTLFVTLPFIVGELVPLMREQGTEEEETALLFGANPWQLFWRVTLPNIKWALLYGIFLCSARALGEFGAVSVVSGHIEGKTNTIPLQVEVLYEEYQFASAFALSSILTLLAFVTLMIRRMVERKNREV